MWSLLKPKKPSKPAASSSARLNEYAAAAGPALEPEEMTANLSTLERKLNGEMKCPAGRNQVFIRSIVTPTGTTRPRIALKCQLRRDIGMAPEVYFGEIRAMCCGDPTQCPAYRALKDRFVQT